MDGVLTDFDAAARRIPGFLPQFNVATDSLPPDLKKEKERFWLITREDPDFWSGLAPIPDGLRLWGAMRHLSPRILTAAPRFNIPEEEVFNHPWFIEVKEKKLAWARKHLNIDDRDFYCTISKLKSHYVDDSENNTNVLIDDRLDNINLWEKSGGTGILFKNYKDAIDQFKSLFPRLIY